jgi:ketosteroid isomerase-like protein
VSANADLLKQGYEDFSSGDIEAATEPWSEDFVWQGPDAEGYPGSGTHEGKDAARQVLQEAVGTWDDFRLSVDEIVDGGGDTLVVLGHEEASKGGNSVKQPVVHVWRFKDGTPVRIQLLEDTLHSARTLGIA